MRNDQIWELFVDSLWELQWTNVETPLTEGLSDELYNLSVGNMDLAVRIFREAQRCIIGSGDEHISIKVLQYAATNAVKATSEVVNKIRVTNAEYDALANAKRSEKVSQAASNELENSKFKEPTANLGTLQTIPGDLARPQHPEFAYKLQLLQQSECLHDFIKDPDYIQRASEDANPVEALEHKGLLYKHPF